MLMIKIGSYKVLKEGSSYKVYQGRKKIGTFLLLSQAKFYLVKRWIDDAFQLGGNDFINWNEIKNVVSEETYQAVRNIIALHNKDVIFAKVSEKEFNIYYNYLEKSL